jgi:hypothetical protein
LAPFKVNNTIAPAVLSDHFLIFLRSKKDSRIRTLHGIVRMFQARYRGFNNTQDSAVKLAISTIQLLDGAFTNALFQPYFLPQMADLSMHSQFYLLFGSFGPLPLTLDLAAHKRKMGEIVAQRQRDNEADAALIHPEPTSIYVNKPVDKDVDLLGIFGNFETMIGSFVDDMYTPHNLPSVIAMTTMIFTILMQDNGRRWTMWMFEHYSNFGEYMVTKMNSLIMLYVSLADAASLMHMDNPVPVTADYQRIEQQFKHFGAELQSAVSVFNTPMSMRPVARILPGAAGPVHHPAVPAPANYNPINARGAVQPMSGIVSHPGSVPVTTRLYPPTGVFGLSPTGVQLPICLNHLLLGRTCTGCNRFHVNHIRDLPEQCVPAFRAWLAGNELIITHRPGTPPFMPGGRGYGPGRGRGVPAGRGRGPWDAAHGRGAVADAAADAAADVAADAAAMLPHHHLSPPMVRPNRYTT